MCTVINNDEGDDLMWILFTFIHEYIRVLMRRYTQGVNAYLLHVPHNAEIVQGTNISELNRGGPDRLATLSASKGVCACV